METHDLVQGSPEWHEHRAKYHNASDAPAMLGLSKYKTRSQLLQEVATKIVPDVDEATQRRFDEGHRVEALARGWAETYIGEELYPVVGTIGNLSASFDGITMDEKVCFEHKYMNDALRGIMTGGIPEQYRSQIEQQLMVSGADKCLFVASRWEDNDYTHTEIEYCWYYPDDEMRQRIIDGWKRFEKDLPGYEPRDIAEKPRAEAIMSLPALVIQIKGEFTLSNLPAFREVATNYIASIKTELETDEDFAQAEANVKFCKEAEEDLDAAKKAAIGQTASIDDLMRTIDHIQAQLRDKRLTLDKLVKTRKVEIKTAIVRDAEAAYKRHLAALEDGIDPIRLGLFLTRPDWESAAKNKKTLTSIHDAVDDVLSKAKHQADETASDIKGKLDWYKANGLEHNYLFHDLERLLSMPIDALQDVVNGRIAEYWHKKEAEKAKEADPVAPIKVKPNPVIENQDNIAKFLKSRTFTMQQELEYRSVIVEYLKFVGDE